jgi:Ca2+/Na+ antiporter
LSLPLYTRGSTLALVWSPVGVTVGAAISGTDSNPGIVIGLGLSFALFIILFDFLMVTLHMKEQVPMKDRSNVNPEPISLRRLILIMTLAFVIFLFVIAALVINILWGLNIIDIVILLIILFSGVWSLILNKNRKFISQVKLKMTKGIEAFSAQLLLLFR